MSAFAPGSAVLCAGWLEKSSVKGGRHTPWKERFCVLWSQGTGLSRRCEVRYYDKAWAVGDKHAPKGEIALHGATLEVGGTAKPLELTIFTAEGQASFPLRAKKPEDHAVWVDRILAAITCDGVLPPGGTRAGSGEVMEGSVVTWVNEDDDVPAGSVGVVVGFKGDSKGRPRALVKFPSGTFPLLISQLVHAVGANLDRAAHGSAAGGGPVVVDGSPRQPELEPVRHQPVQQPPPAHGLSTSQRHGNKPPVERHDNLEQPGFGGGGSSGRGGNGGSGGLMRQASAPGSSWPRSSEPAGPSGGGGGGGGGKPLLRMASLPAVSTVPAPASCDEWVEIESDDYPGHFYYQSEATQEVTWDRPAGVIKGFRGRPSAPAAQPSDSKGSGGRGGGGGGGGSGGGSGYAAWELDDDGGAGLHRI